MAEGKNKKTGKSWPKIRAGDAASANDINEEFLDIQDKRREVKKIGSKKYRELTNIMWELATNALLHCTKGQQLYPEIASWLAQSASEIASGRVPEEIQMAQKKGTPSDTYWISDAKRGAALYYRAAKIGSIEDKDPVSTLSEKFGCSKQTIRDWVKKFPEDLWGEFFPDSSIEIRKKSLIRTLNYDSKLIKEKSKTQEAHRFKGKKRTAK